MVGSRPSSPIVKGSLERLRPALVESLTAMHTWFRRMQDPHTHRMAYMYIPDTDETIWDATASPIRDLGNVAVLATLQTWAGNKDFDATLSATLRHYEAMIVHEAGHEAEGPATAEGLGGTETEAELAQSPLPWAYLDSSKLGEPSTIAHSAMMILGLAAWEGYPNHSAKERLVIELSHGICHQQKKDGRFRIRFPAPPSADSDTSNTSYNSGKKGNVNAGWELYGGEAELALAISYRAMGEEKFLQAAYRAFVAYGRDFESEQVRSSSFTFFANWQCQAAEALLPHMTHATRSVKILREVSRLQQEIIRHRRFWDDVVDVPQMSSIVEVACALEGLVAAYGALVKFKSMGQCVTEEEMEVYEKSIVTGVEFLISVQVRHQDGGESSFAVGGFGFSATDRRQRVDVTGHVCSAFLKLLTLID